MLSKINVTALKSIDTLELNCKKLNIITGTNSSGKSTVLQAILLFFQSHEAMFPGSKKDTGLNGNLISLGEFRENTNYNIANDTIEVKLTFDQYEDCHSSIEFSDEGAYAFMDVDGVETALWTENYGMCHIFEDFNEGDEYTKFQLKYLSCNRIGSSDVYAKSYTDNEIGINGEYAIHFLNKNQKTVLDKELIKDSSSETLSAQINYWLKYIVNSAITTEDIVGTDIVKASYSVDDRRNTRPKNIGSGVSYLISILILCLSSKKEDILIIENPEIHLHPKAQSRVCEFLYFIARSGIQIFVETHSDHIFNGVRAGLVQGEMEHENVSVNFFSLDEKGCTKNTVVEFGKRGRIINYEKDLFDQFDLDLNKMLDL